MQYVILSWKEALKAPAAASVPERPMDEAAAAAAAAALEPPPARH